MEREIDAITANVQRGGSETRRALRTIIRYEEDGDHVVAVCEGLDGDRWYEIILIKGEPRH